MQTKTSQTKTQKAVNQPKQEITPSIKHNVAVSDSSPVIGLDPMAGIQSSNSVTTGTIQIATGVAFDANIADTTDTDIKTIKVVLGGAGLNEANDKLVLDAELALNADIAKVTGKTIGTVSGLEYSYTHASKTLIISKTSGAFNPADVAKVVEAIQLKNTDTASQLGTRVATITYTDTNGNESEPATASLSVALYRGFVINGEAVGDQSGRSVSSAGDVNGDGLDDLIVGAWGADPSGKSEAGKSYVVFGKANGSAIDLSTIANANNPLGGFVINGEAVGDSSGFSVSSAGDVNGDGLDDLIVGARGANSSTGKSYVVFGKANSNAINLSTIADASNPTGGFVINGEAAGDQSGFSVSSAGDVNGDGLDDLIVGAYDYDAELARSYVVFGKANSNAINLSTIADASNPTGGFVINGESEHGYSNISVSSAGDVNGDGLDDLIVGASAAAPSGKSYAGKSYVVFGKANSSAIDLSAIADASNPTGGFVINGETTNDNSGCSVSSAGDVNGDGLDDLIVGAFKVNSSGKVHAGKSYVVFGKADSSAINLSTIADASNPLGGFVINGDAAYDRSGFSVSSAGDVNGDGLDDLIVGARYADPSGKSEAGKSYVVFGKANGSAIDLSTIANANNPLGGFVINGEAAGDQNGISVSSAGDVNGDGLDDLIVSSYQADPNGRLSAGKSYVIFGKTDTDAIDLTNLSGDSKYAIDYLGDKNANTLTGTYNDEIFVAGAGDDTLTGNGGMDVFNAGLGKDSILINASNISALEQTGAGNRARVDGGGGVDTLKLDGADLTLDLTKISNTRIQDIEIIDIRGSGNNILELNLNDLLAASTSTNILKVLGNSGDTVNTSGFVKTSTETENGITYDVYTHSDANTDAKAALWVQQGVGMKDMQRGFVVINGEVVDDWSDWSVSNAGNVNGNGLDDLIVVGVYQSDPSGKSNADKPYVIFDKTNTDAIYVIDYLGNKDTNTLTSTATNKDEIFVAGAVENTLKLNLDDLLHASSSANILEVLGDSGDKVNTAGFSDSTIDKTVDSITYDIYTHSDANTHANVELWAQQEIVML